MEGVTRLLADNAIDLKGKQYLQVVHRVNLFRESYGLAYGIETEILVDDGTRVLMVAYIKDNDGRVVGKGHAEEIRNAGPVNRTSAIENCETSAIGRALANIGLAGNEYASAFEMENIPNKEKAKASQDKAKKVADDEEKQLIDNVHKILTVSVNGTDNLKTMRANWSKNKQALDIMKEKYTQMYSDLEAAFIAKSKKLKENENDESI
jgi:hypothetical protein